MPWVAESKFEILLGNILIFRLTRILADGSKKNGQLRLAPGRVVQKIGRLVGHQ